MVRLIPFFIPAAVICLSLAHLIPGKGPRVCAIIALVLGIFALAAMLF